MIFSFRAILRAGKTPALFFAPLVLVIVSAGLSRTMRPRPAEDIQRKDQHLYQNRSELVVTRDGAVINRLPCERIDLDYPDAPATHQVGTELGRTRSGELYASISSGRIYRSADGGRTWTGWSTKLAGEEGPGGLCVLADDSFLAVRENRFYRSTDRGRTWEMISEVSPDPFDIIDINSLVQLKNGTILCPINRYNSPTLGEKAISLENQYVFRSEDGGRTWQGGGDKTFWESLKQAHLQLVGRSLESRFPGMGGTFPGCWETQVTELASGKLIAAFRYSGAPQPWHLAKSREWGMEEARQQLIPLVPGLAGDDRILKYVFLGDSLDSGKTWKNLRPVLDANSRSVLRYGSLNGQIVEVPDGRLVLVKTRRYPREEQQTIARISEDGGKTWLRDEYRISYGSGYPRGVVLKDGTIVIISGTTLTTPGGPPPPGGHFTCQVVRWRLPERSRR